MLKTFKYCLLLIAFVSVVAQQPNDVTSSTDSNSSYDLANLCREFLIDAAQIEGLEVIIFSIDTIAHELGHATASKTLFDVHDPIKIHIGKCTMEDTTPRLFSLGNMHFYKTIPWQSGITEFGKMYLKRNRLIYENLDLGVETAAGSLFAAALMYFLLSAITGYCAYCDNKKLSETT